MLGHSSHFLSLSFGIQAGTAEQVLEQQNNKMLLYHSFIFKWRLYQKCFFNKMDKQLMIQDNRTAIGMLRFVYSFIKATYVCMYSMCVCVCICIKCSSIEAPGLP